jgi:hypothetical protein
VWLSPVEHTVRDREVEGSNPSAPTKKDRRKTPVLFDPGFSNLRELKKMVVLRIHYSREWSENKSTFFTEAIESCSHRIVNTSLASI